MGYETNYTLTVIPDTFKAQAIEELIKQVGHNCVDGDDYKWYSHHVDMLNISKKVPALLILDGEGEEAGDIWRRSYLNGELVMDWKLPPVKPPEPSKELVTSALALANELGTPLGT